jgi:hypothetical protein
MGHKDSVKVQCDCHCGILEFEKDEDGYISITHYISTFYGEQKGLWNTILDRSKMVWSILTGKKYALYELILTEQESEKLLDLIKKVTDED